VAPLAPCCWGQPLVSRAAEIDAAGMSDPVPDGENAPNKNSRFMQQQLPSWQPLMTPCAVIPGFLLVGAGFIAVGAVIISLQSDLKSYGPVAYDEIGQCSTALANSPCYQSQYNVAYGPDVKYNALKPLNPLCVPLSFEEDTTPEDPSNDESNVCEVDITLTEDWDGPVYFYYILTNFYQNHRLYVADRADYQLTGSNSRFYDSIFTDLRSELPTQGCSADVLPGGLFCTGTEAETPWTPISAEVTMGTSQGECEDGGHVRPRSSHSQPPHNSPCRPTHPPCAIPGGRLLRRRRRRRLLVCVCARARVCACMWCMYPHHSWCARRCRRWTVRPRRRGCGAHARAPRRSGAGATSPAQASSRSTPTQPSTRP
jgi:hypothetical protein